MGKMTFYHLNKRIEKHLSDLGRDFLLRKNERLYA